MSYIVREYLNSLIATAIVAVMVFLAAGYTYQVVIGIVAVYNNDVPWLSELALYSMFSCVFLVMVWSLTRFTVFLLKHVRNYLLGGGASEK